MRIIQTTKILMMFSVAAVGLAAVGCDSTTTCADGGVCPDGGAGGMGHGGSTGAGGGAGGAGGARFGVTEGTYCFDITAATPTSDGCGIFEGVTYVGMKIPVTYTAATGAITVGTMGSLGAGLLTPQNTGTLTRMNSPFDPDMPTCTWDQTDMTMLELTATNTFTAVVTETQSNFAPVCTLKPATDPCTSTFTLKLAIHPTALMPDPTTGLCPM